MTVFSAHNWRDNAELIADVGSMGFIKGKVLDATFGMGIFWNDFKPDELVTNDLHVESADFHYDYRQFPEDWENEFETVVFDPPYKLNGTPDNELVDVRYGVHRKQSVKDRMDSIIDGAKECYRCVKKGGFLLVKVQNQVSSGRMWFQTDLVTQALNELGAKKVAELHFLRTPRPQPSGRAVKHPRSNFSTLMIFKK